MKKKRYYFSSARYWNKLVHKFYDLNNKISKLIFGQNASNLEVNFLLSRLKKLYKKLSRLQVKAGVKIAGSALALMLATTSLNAQTYTQVENLQFSELISQWFPSPTFADLDGDGNPELFVGNQDGYVLEYSQENGIYSFVDTLRANGNVIDYDYTSPTFEDLDGDGDLDLYLGIYPGYVLEFLNDGSGNFGDPVPLSAGGSYIHTMYLASPEFEDIDGDGDLDLYVGDYYGYINFYENDGTNNFLAGTRLQADGTDYHGDTYSAPTFEDIDGDGDLDIYVGGYFGYISVLENDGNGNFSDIGLLQVDGSDYDIGYVSNPVFSDIDNDGDLDLYVGGYSMDTHSFFISYIQNDGTGTFAFKEDLLYEVGDIQQSMGTSVEFGDFDNDGDADLFVGNYSSNFIFYYENMNNNFVFSDTLRADGAVINIDNMNSIELQDLDADGDIDVYLGMHNGYIFEFLNDGNGNLSFSDTLRADGAPINMGGWTSPEFADIDGDGDLDLYVGDWNGNIHTFINDGSNNFTSNGLLQADEADIRVNYWAAPVFSDLDDDGDLDLVVGDYYGNVSKFINDGTGVFTADGIVMADGNPVDIGYMTQPEFANLDNNCNSDLFVGNVYGTIAHFEYQDVTAPIPDVAELPIITGECSAILTPPTATDDCEGVITATTTDSTEYAEQGTYNVHWTYTDASGNVETQMQTVVIDDVTDPTITCMGDTTVYADNSNTYTIAGTSFDPTDYTDNCGIDTVYNSYNSTGTLDGEILNPGNYSVTWFVEDKGGNFAYCSMNITVNQYVGLQDLADIGVSIFPNPTAGILNISNATGFNLEIRDIQGKIVESYSNISENNLQIDLSDQAPGIYLVKLFNNSEVKTTKIIVK